jgi:hypothetical protein
MTAIAIDGLKNFEFAWKAIDLDAIQNNVNRASFILPSK